MSKSFKWQKRWEKRNSEACLAYGVGRVDLQEDPPELLAARKRGRVAEMKAAAQNLHSMPRPLKPPTRRA